MTKSKWVRWTMVGGLVGAMALAGTLAAAFPAQAAELSSGVRSITQFGFGSRIVDWWALLAEELGISTDELAQAVDAANVAAIEQAVDDGVITQEQADQLQEAGRFLGFGRGHGPGFGPGGSGPGFGPGGFGPGSRPGRGDGVGLRFFAAPVAS